MDYTTTDLTLAIAHHLLIFSLAGVLTYEIAAVRVGLDRDAILRVAKVDAWYGILAVAIIVVGVLRVSFAAKGWDYYRGNPYFWAKMASFAIVGILSIWPTVAYLRWKRASAPPDARAVASVRRYLWLEAAFFALIVIFAATMARMT